MEVRDWVAVISVSMALIVNAIAVFRGIKFLSLQLAKEFGLSVEKALSIHKEEAAATERRFNLIETEIRDQKVAFRELHTSHSETRTQLSKIEDMLSEVREAMFSLIKKS